LIEMAHSLDTNLNKAFNQICTWYAPKNKVFAGSYSLHNRIAFLSVLTRSECWSSSQESFGSLASQ
jgi:hypothetical protein